VIKQFLRVLMDILDRKPLNTGMDTEPTGEDMYSLDPKTIDSAMIYAAMPQIKSMWIEHIQVVFARYEITGRDAALLLAHIGHESQDLNRLAENLNYSAERLMQVWPSRFRTIERARQFERNPEALANEVYGGRMGNNREGDGWKFRGRGPIQITGRDNYTQLEKDTGLPVVNNPDLLMFDPEAGIESACWFWRRYVHDRSIEGSTRNINGGLHGLADRTKRFQAAEMHV